MSIRCQTTHIQCKVELLNTVRSAYRGGDVCSNSAKALVTQLGTSEQNIRRSSDTPQKKLTSSDQHRSVMSSWSTQFRTPTWDVRTRCESTERRKAVLANAQGDPMCQKKLQKEKEGTQEELLWRTKYQAQARSFRQNIGSRFHLTSLGWRDHGWGVHFAHRVSLVLVKSHRRTSMRPTVGPKILLVANMEWEVQRCNRNARLPPPKDRGFYPDRVGPLLLSWAQRWWWTTARLHKGTRR